MIGTAAEVVSWPIIAELGSIVLMKATVILSAAVLGTWLLRRQSAATRSAVWSAALGLLLVLPVLSVVLPSWQIRHFEEAGTAGRPGVPVVDRSAAQPHSSSSREVENVAAAEGAPQEASIALQGVGAAAVFLVLLWACGSLLMLLRLGLHADRAYRISLGASPADRRELADVHREDSEHGRPVRILLSDDVPVPCSWGAWDPVVVLPSAAREWPARAYSQRRAPRTGAHRASGPCPSSHHGDRPCAVLAEPPDLARRPSKQPGAGAGMR